jgi:hypothetical protein
MNIFVVFEDSIAKIVLIDKSMEYDVSLHLIIHYRQSLNEILPKKLFEQHFITFNMRQYE